MPKVDLQDRYRIVFLHEQGRTQRQIAVEVGCSQSSVHKILKKKLETGSVLDKPKQGRPKKVTAREDQYLKVTSLRHRTRGSARLAQDLQEATGVAVHSSTVRRHLIKQGLRGRVARRKPLLRHGNRQKRLTYARNHSQWTVEEWRRVLWTDESKFEIFGSKRRQYVRRRVGEAYNSACIQPTVKHGGGSIQVWGSITASGVGPLVRIDGRLNADRYLQILQEHAIPAGRRLIGEGFIFQQDNDPKHTARVVRRYLAELEEQNICETMVWPPQSPDLNIIENVWDYLDRAKHRRQPRTANDLFNILEEEWNNIPPEFINNLINSVPNRLRRVIQAKGGHTKY